MSRQHWVDEFFRKRMKRRTFPVEAGEFEEVRALLDKRNVEVAIVRGSGLSKWWLTALLPLAGLLWWSLNGDSGESDLQGSLVGVHLSAPSPDHEEEHPVPATSTRVEAALTEGSSATDTVNDAARAVFRMEGDAPTVSATGEGTGSARNAQASLATRSMGLATAEGIVNPRVVMGGAERPSLRNGIELDPSRSNAEVQGGNGTAGMTGDGVERQRDLLSARTDGPEGIQPDPAERGKLNPSTVGVPVDDPEEVPPGLGSGVDADQDRLNAHIVSKADVITADVLDLASDRRVTDAVVFVEPRWSRSVEIDARKPVGREMPTFKWLAMGELYFFGAPLAVRTRTSDGERSGAETGSLFGLEYRVRAKRLTWSTGIYYGSYALKADQGADVMLNFVEVPVLASVKLARGRFGLLMQGGLSVDLLFNARGRYPLEEEDTAAGFPEDAFRTVNCSWLLRPQASFYVNEHLSLCAGPLWKGQLGEVAKKGSLDGAQVSAMGLSFGITWRLERTTF